MTIPRVLIAGESWVTHSIHQKGFDSFTTTEYVEGVDALRAALVAGGYAVDYQPSHIAMRDFPPTAAALASYACVILSDIGANSLLLHPDTFNGSVALPNRVRGVAEYVREGGGGLVMVGGYLTFQGIDGKGRWHDTPVEDVLPVTISPVDDRVEEPSGVEPVPTGEHPITTGIVGRWPDVLGYNKVTADEGSEVVVTVGEDPLLAVGEAGHGRTAAFTSDCAPHWAPPTFVSWEHYNRLWKQIIDWTVRR